MILSVLVACGRPWINVCQMDEDHGVVVNDKNGGELCCCGGQGCSLEKVMVLLGLAGSERANYVLV